MSQLPTWWYRTEHFWLGVPIMRSSLLLSTHRNIRISSLADDSTAQAILSHAIIVLGSAAFCAYSEAGEAAQGLYGIGHTSPRYYLACRVGRSFLVLPIISDSSSRWSYGVNMTWIGISGMLWVDRMEDSVLILHLVFITMDVSDVFLAVRQVYTCSDLSTDESYRYLKFATTSN